MNGMKWVSCLALANETPHRAPAKHFGSVACSCCCFTPPTPSISDAHFGTGCPARAPPVPRTLSDNPGPWRASCRGTTEYERPLHRRALNRQKQQPYIDVSGGGSDSQTLVNGTRGGGEEGPDGKCAKVRPGGTVGGGGTGEDWRPCMLHMCVVGPPAPKFLTARYTQHLLGPFFLLIQKVNSPSWPPESG
jgi:hypothetical protein